MITKKEEYIKKYQHAEVALDKAVDKVLEGTAETPAKVLKNIKGN